MPEQTAVERTFAAAKAEQPAATGPDPTRVQKISLLTLVLLASMYTLYFAAEVLLPVFLAILLALLLRPPVRVMRRLRVPEPLGAGLVILVGLGLFATLGVALSEPAIDWINRLPMIVEELRRKVEVMLAGLREARQATEQLERMADGGGGPAEVVVRGPSLASEILSRTQVLLAQVALTVALTFFFLAFGRHTLESVLRSMPKVKDRLHLADIVNTIRINVSSYLVTVTVINGLLGLVTSAAMWGLGMPNPLLWGMLAGLLNFVPYLGSALMTGILAVVALLSFDTPLRILAPPAVWLMLTALEGNFLTPTVVGRRLTLNPIFVFATVLFWGWLWGVPGALLAVPILATVKIICDATPPLRTIGALLGG